jgi:hypothetical protein
MLSVAANQSLAGAGVEKTRKRCYFALLVIKLLLMRATAWRYSSLGYKRRWADITGLQTCGRWKYLRTLFLSAK